MFLMEKVSNSLAEKISKELSYDEDKKEVIAYGTYAILQISISIIFVVIFGWIFGVLAEALVVSLSGAALRSYTGGAHASTPNICIVVGTTVCIGLALLTQLMIFKNIWLVLGLVLVSHITAYWLIVRLAPVASSNKPISDKRRTKMKRGGLVFNTVLFFISISFIIIAAVVEKSAILVFPVAISLSVLWQMFSITTIGGKWLGALDRFLSRKVQKENIG